MTSLTDQFLSKLRGNVLPTPESPTPPTTSPTQSGESFSDASSIEPTSDDPMLKIETPKKTLYVDSVESLAEAFAMFVGWIAGVLLCAFIVHWILGLVSLGNFTYWQLVGLITIWELLKPRSSSS